MAKLTGAVCRSIAEKAAKDLFASELLEQFKIAEKQIIALVKKSYEDFDYEHVEPYRRYIEWHDKIGLVLPKEWYFGRDAFAVACGLPSISRFKLPFQIPFQILPNQSACFIIYLDDRYTEQALDILRPYVVKYLTAKEAYEGIKETLFGLNTYKQLEDTIPELGPRCRDVPLFLRFFRPEAVRCQVRASACIGEKGKTA
jgi:hypothetical protein